MLRGSGRGGGGARREGGCTHMAGNPMLRLSRARAGVGQPVHRGSEELTAA